MDDLEYAVGNCDDLNAIVTELRGRADDTDIRRLLEQALRLGCRGAADW
jgi:hypothetical protein